MITPLNRICLQNLIEFMSSNKLCWILISLAWYPFDVRMYTSMLEMELRS